MVFLFESDLAFLGIITLILLQVILLTVSRSDVIPVCRVQFTTISHMASSNTTRAESHAIIKFREECLVVIDL